jgi:hypothetical protein
VDVAELLNSFIVGIYVEIVVARLPDVLFGACLGEALFDDLDCKRERGFFRFGDEEVDVVRHCHVAVNGHAVKDTCSVEDGEEGVSCFG